MNRAATFAAVALAYCLGCDGGTTTPDAGPPPDGSLAEDIFAPPGEPLPFATAEERALFDRGAELAQRRWDLTESFGPSHSVSACVDCHGRPTLGGRGGLSAAVRLVRQELDTDQLIVGLHGSQPLMTTGPEVLYPPPPTANAFARRQPSALYGVGLLGLVPEEEVFRNADPADEDGDGVSGVNAWDRGFIARFGLKADSSDVELFVRGQVFEHLGLSSLPLTTDERSSLPLGASTLSRLSYEPDSDVGAARWPQGIDPNLVLIDSDDVDDPELSNADLFALVSWVRLLAVPPRAAPTEESTRGEARFEEIGCTGCHVPRLGSPLGALPAYTDLLVHDMGPGLSDGIQRAAGAGTEDEYRTTPLWAAGLGGPYLHDGRASTLHDAIVAHGGEADTSARAYEALADAERADVLAFLRSFGGDHAAGEGTEPEGAEPPPTGTLGGPAEGIDAERFARGRARFDRLVPMSEGVGPRYDADTCGACHRHPALGGGGGRGAIRVRAGRWESDAFAEVPAGPWWTRYSVDATASGRLTESASYFERRLAPPLFVAGMLGRVDAAAVSALADPDDLDGDGVSGRAPERDGSLLRFGWQSTHESAEAATRGCLASAMGLTSGGETDADEVADPEYAEADVADLVYFVEGLAVPPAPADASLFIATGCADCHTPELPATDGGDLALYSDLLLHELSDSGPGVAEGAAGPREYRTAPLRAVAHTAPYMHDGRALTLEEAIAAHGAEGAAAAAAFSALDASEREALLEFLVAL